MICRHFFWDYDGTLYDTYPRITRAIVRTMQEYGVEAAYDDLYPLLKRKFRVAWAAYLEPKGISYEEFMDTYHRFSEQEPKETMQLYPGAGEMLAAVVRNGGRNYLYTHRGQSALGYLERDGLMALFTDFVTSQHNFPNKPAPDALNYLCNKHGLKKEDCIMIGDRDIDLDSGKNAGMACALFDPEGYYPDYDTPWRFSRIADMQAALIGK